MTLLNLLDRKILDLIEAQIVSEKELDAVFAEVFAHQFEEIEAYRRFCEANHVTPGNVKRFSEIPPYPTAGFKHHRLASFPASDVVATFHTSGTTRAETGIHLFNTLELYDRASIRSFERFILRPFFSKQDRTERLMLLSLIPSDLEAPRSSLAHMVATLAREFSNGDVTYALTDSAIDPPAAQAALLRSQKTGTPVWIAATSTALSDLLALFESKRIAFRLPEGSFLFETGGRKGRRYLPSSRRLSELAEEHLGLAADRYFGEYGMTEISSPAWGRLIAGRMIYQSPAWAPYRILNPKTREDVPAGEEGMIAVFDPANRGSVSALWTGDWGRRNETGFEVLGRVVASEIRGCSLQTARTPQTEPCRPHAKLDLSGILSTARSAPNVSLPESVKVLGDLAKNWLNPAFSLRREFEISLQKDGYFSEGSVTEGLNLTFEALTGEKLEAAAQRAWRKMRPKASDRVLLQISAGNLPVTGVFPFFAALLSGIPSIHRPSRRSGNLLNALQNSLAAVHPALASRAAVVSTNSGDDEATRNLLAPATAAIVQGDEETIEHLTALAPTRTRIVAYGPKFSAAILPNEITPTEKEWDLLARDMLIWEQQGCLSPQALFLHASSKKPRRELAQAFSQAFARRSREWKRKPHSRWSGAVQWHAFEQDFHQADGCAVAFPDRLRTDWFATPGLIQWIEYKDERELASLLENDVRHLSSLALPPSALEESGHISKRFPTVRVTSWGQLQAPEFDWPQDGHDRLLSLF